MHELHFNGKLSYIAVQEIASVKWVRDVEASTTSASLLAALAKPPVRSVQEQACVYWRKSCLCSPYARLFVHALCTPYALCMPYARLFVHALCTLVCARLVCALCVVYALCTLVCVCLVCALCFVYAFCTLFCARLMHA
jgi:hypothetical protein